MKTYKDFFDIVRHTRVLRFPRHRLATFGQSEIEYHLVTSVSSDPAQSNLRTGLVVAMRPKIVTPESLVQRFQGFGDGADEFAKWLAESKGESFRALEYQFSNQPREKLAHHVDARALAETIGRDLDQRNPPRTALIASPEAGWRLALMKFILEETFRSFRDNMRELDERGLFDPSQISMTRQKREIESLFQAARQNRAELATLSRKLKEYGMFEEYQDRFFQLATTN